MLLVLKIIAIAWFAKFRLVARLEAWIASLPPYPALAIFALPGALLFPVNLLGLWLLASGHVIWAGALLVGAKIVSTAFVARLFMLTQPKLMQIGWFRRGYEWFMPWKEALFAYVRASFAWRYGRMVKTRIKQIAKRAWADVKPRMKAAWLEVRTRGRLMWRRLTGAA